jgi:class 3 adenylate cyclase/predicted ATPase
VTRTTADLAEWLGKYGLDQYTRAFVDNHIDYALLPDLTENDLRNLGVSLGHRKTLLRAIETLKAARRASDITTTASDPRTEALPPLEHPPLEHPPLEHREAERRQITVMFCDLVGSTQLSEKMDPEDLQVVIDAFRDVCTTAIGRYQGRVARFVGDGMMAFFGWPYAHEDDAIRAVHAALEILAAVAGIPGQVALASRAGVSSGPVVVVGEIAGSGTAASMDMDAVGETPNIAARLQTLAAPNTLVISESTKRLVSAAFDFQDLGSQELKGVTKPLHVYRVHAATHIGSRFEAAHEGSLSPLVGRSTELNLLLDRWQKAKEGDGQVILLSGIPGVGKSRLIHELKSSIQHEPCFVLQHQCSPFHNQSAFFPVIEHFEQAAKLAAGDSDADKLAKLKAYLPQPADDSMDAALLIANLLSIPIPDYHELSELTPQQIKNRTLSKLVDTVLAFSAQQPTLCIFEDVHWIDPSSHELIELIINQIARARVLLIVSHRPEFRPVWFTDANVTMHSLTRLSRSEVTGMIRDLLKGRSVPQEILDQIIEKTDGLPLFIEELTSSVFRTPIESRPGEGDSERNAHPPVPSVPETLHDALMERLDRLAQGRRLAQIAAVIGREFSYDLLSLALPIDDNDLRRSLSRLEEADIIHRVGVSPFIRFAFKHALLRDAIYNSLLRSTRRQSHANIATILAKHYCELVENRPEILAYHYGESGNYELAMRCWYKSGQHALAHSANVEAIAQFRKALEALSALPDTPERDKQEIEIQLALGIPLIAVRGYPAEETREAFARARTLCLKLDSRSEYFQALFGLWGNCWMGGRNDEALSMANEFLSRSQTSADAVPLMVAHRVMGSTLLCIGEFQSSRQHFEESIALSKRKGKRSLYKAYMVEPQAASLLLLSWDLWFLGYPDQSLARVLEALALARELAQPYTIAFAHYMTSVVHLLRGEPDLALASAEESLEMSQEQRFSLYALLSKISRGRALGSLGQTREAQTQIKLGLDEARSKGVGYMLPMMNSWLAEMQAQSGEHQIALSMVEQTLAQTNDATGRSWESELHHQRARILLALDPASASEAELHLNKAVEVARRQSARSLELRAATSLAELWRSQERFDEARELIGSIYRWFDEGIGTEDMRRARDAQLGLPASGGNG